MFLPLQAEKATVLIVDDSPDIRRYLRLLLELDSYHVETASDGIEALERLQNGSSSPQIVLLDIQMPGMDGFKTLRHIRKRHPAVKVIMCSGEEDPRKKRRAASLGAQAYITKPIQHLYLSAALEFCLLGEAPLPETALGSLVMFPSQRAIN